MNLNTLPYNTCSGTKLHRVGIRVAQAHPSPQGAQVWGMWVTFRQETQLGGSTAVFSPGLACQAGSLFSCQHRTLTPGGSEEAESFQTPWHECTGGLTPIPSLHLSPSSVVLCLLFPFWAWAAPTTHTHTPEDEAPQSEVWEEGAKVSQTLCAWMLSCHSQPHTIWSWLRVPPITSESLWGHTNF